jgi:hypothetical protein
LRAAAAYAREDKGTVGALPTSGDAFGARDRANRRLQLLAAAHPRDLLLAKAVEFLTCVTGSRGVFYFVSPGDGSFLPAAPSLIGECASSGAASGAFLCPGGVRDLGGLFQKPCKSGPSFILKRSAASGGRAIGTETAEHKDFLSLVALWAILTVVQQRP